MINPRIIKFIGHVVHMADENAHASKDGILKRKIPHGRPRRRWEYNIKFELRKQECELDLTGSGWFSPTGFG